MKLIVREMDSADQTAWAEMRAALWPEETKEAHARAVAEVLADPEAWGFVAQADDRTAAGFAEIAVRKYANGCDSRPVPFLEGIWIRPQFRRRGIGARLIRHAEDFLLTRGFTELGSDTVIDNRSAQAAHTAWGFSETERVVYFRKILKPPAL
ncbi:MAG: GNAT family N-acetyltransferase [Stellaceae bacterium]